MRVAAYLRVSTQEQTTANQLQAIEAWVKSRGHELAEVYQENESAWRSGHQRGLARLLSDLRPGHRKYNILLVWSLDRLSRAGIGPILSLVKTCRDHGCQVVSVQEPWLEQSGPMADLLLAVVGWVSKFESDRRSERTRAGLERVRKNGSRSGKGIGQRRPDKQKRHRAGYLSRWAGKQTSANEDAQEAVLTEIK